MLYEILPFDRSFLRYRTDILRGCNFSAVSFAYPIFRKLSILDKHVSKAVNKHMQHKELANIH